MKPGTMPAFRLAFIINTLKELNPDIIGIQEINESLDVKANDNQCKKIAEELSLHFNTSYKCYQQFTHLSWDNQFREFIGIITKHNVIDSGYHQLATGVFPRKVVWNYLETPLGRVNFFNTHLSFNSPDVRLQQVEQILDYVDETKANNPSSAVVLTGDFNDAPDAASIQLITDEEQDTTYLDSFTMTNPGSPGYTVPSNSPNKRIDYIFVENFSNLGADNSMVISDSVVILDLYRSDHLAVISNLKEINNAEVDTRPGLKRKPFILYQNFPNPFNETTSIKYDLFEKSHVRISLYSQAGTFISLLEDEEKAPGTYIIPVTDSKHIKSAGFIKLEVSGESQVMKIVPVR
jgi:endonuclease/exonuclease/phosphatase family metal-dependent hydrolase